MTHIHDRFHGVCLDNPSGVLPGLMAVWCSNTQLNPTSYIWSMHQEDSSCISLFDILIANKIPLNFHLFA